MLLALKFVFVASFVLLCSIPFLAKRELPLKFWTQGLGLAVLGLWILSVVFDGILILDVFGILRR